MKKIHPFCIAVLLFVISASAQNNVETFIFCSDLHFGFYRQFTFSPDKKTDTATAVEVNTLMVNAMNKMLKMKLPPDGGVGSNDSIKGIEAVIITGDIVNREDSEIEVTPHKRLQSATESWKQFENVYKRQLKLKKKDGSSTKLLVTAGNHDVSNVIGHYWLTQPVDTTAYIGIYNMVMEDSISKKNFDYKKNKIRYSKNMSGVHFEFINLWPDSEERIWMERDLKKVSPTTPVLIFAHSGPHVQTRFFTNPNEGHRIDTILGFENLLDEYYKDSKAVDKSSLLEPKIEEDSFDKFVLKYPNIIAYFHGHNHIDSTYTDTIDSRELRCFEVGSPMKTHDEKELSFDVITIDLRKDSLTVRRYKWNTDLGDNWGKPKTISLRAKL